MPGNGGHVELERGTNMRIEVFQHVPFEGPAHIGRWAAAKGCPVHITRLHDGMPLPDMGAFDFLVLMGGPMNIYDDHLHPWLPRERLFIQKALDAGKTMLGVCLGAQLLADALGSPVYRGEHREIGWFPVDLTEQASSSALFADFPARFHAFHWHGDTFRIPAQALHIARSQGCESQAFCWDDRVVGLQFHLETTTESVDLLLENCAHEIGQGPFMQPPPTIRKLTGRHLRQAQGLMERLLDRLTA
jgi:GMP synthase-like glutamine amidotransferase